MHLTGVGTEMWKEGSREPGVGVEQWKGAENWEWAWSSRRKGAENQEWALEQWKGAENPRSCGQLQSVRNEVNAFLKLSCVEQCESRADD